MLLIHGRRRHALAGLADQRTRREERQPVDAYTVLRLALATTLKMTGILIWMELRRTKGLHTAVEGRILQVSAQGDLPLVDPAPVIEMDC